MEKNKFYFAEWYLKKQTEADQALLKSNNFIQRIIKQTAKAVLVEIIKFKEIEISGKVIMQKLGSKSFWVPRSAFFENLEAYTNYLSSYHLLIPEGLQIERVQSLLFAIAKGRQKPFANVTIKFKNRSKELFKKVGELKTMRDDYDKKEEFKKKMYYKTIEIMIKEKKDIKTIDSKISYILENQEDFFFRCKLIILLLKNQEKRDEREDNTEIYKKNKLFLQNCSI